MLEFVERLTVRPWAMRERDAEKLRGAGFTDEQILAGVLVTSFFSLATRIASALGVELDRKLMRD